MTTKQITLTSPRHKRQLEALYRDAWRLSKLEKRARIRSAYREWKRKQGEKQ